MPAFQFRVLPSTQLYDGILGLYGIGHDQLNGKEFFPKVDTETFSALDKNRDELKRIYRTVDWERCLPEKWCKRTSIQILRHFLRSRRLVLKTRVKRISAGTTSRIYYCEKTLNKKTTSSPFTMATRLSISRPNRSELFEY